MAARPRARSSRSQNSRTSDFERPPPQTKQEPDPEQKSSFDPCAATASYFLYAQKNVIVVLNHDSLSVERKFVDHKDEVLLIVADNVSERGGGRQIASYDAGQNAIVWDLFTGSKIAQFSSYEDIRAAAWMRDGSVVFGNTQGNIILFEPSSEEHVSTRTIYDPITALAPSTDCRTFAIGYQNGSILVATLHPSFTIHHTLNTARAPSPITGLAWHGSSSKQKTDMLATQTKDGDTRIWSVAKAPHSDQPRVIRILGDPNVSQNNKSWFSWSKNGRIVNHTDGDTRAWDVRTKKMTSDIVPTIDNVIAIANYGPSAALFTVGRNHTIQQYDISANEGPVMVKNVQHVPPNAPPTPPDSIEEHKLPMTVPMQILSSEPSQGPPSINYETSEDEGLVLSPLQKIKKEMDDLADERRDQLAPLSPISSRASMSSASSYGRPHRRRSPAQTNKSNGSSEGTIFSGPSSMAPGNDNMSIHTGNANASSAQYYSDVRKTTMRGPNESNNMKSMELFPYSKARLSEVKFRPPQYPSTDITSDVLRREMLSVVFGWDHDVESLIRDEQSRHRPGSAASVLLSKWLGDSGADSMTSMVASESMTSTDWMLLALTANMGNGPQKQMGEAFVRRSLEANEIHPAVAILLGLGSQNEAIEVYVSRKYYLEAILLTCLIFPGDWQRQSHLVRRWGEWAVSHGNPDLAVRCFSCTGIESSEPWFSPRSQDMVYQAQQKASEARSTSPTTSPPSAGSSGRLTTKNASLKLITSFGDKGLPKPQEYTMGSTPIVDTAVTPGGNWKRPDIKTGRDLSETRTATPGGHGRERFPSSSRRAGSDTASNHEGRRPRRQATPGLSDAEEPTTTIENSHPATLLPSPHPAAFNVDRSRERATSKDRNHQNLHIDMINAEEGDETQSLRTGGSLTSRGRHRRSASGVSRSSKLSAPNPETDPISPAMTTSNSLKSFKGRNIDRYIESLEEANMQAQQYRIRAESRERYSRSRTENRSQSRGAQEPTYIAPSKRSPSSPKSMTAEDASKFTTARDADTEKSAARPATADPTMSRRARSSSRRAASRTREESPTNKAPTQPVSRSASRQASRTNNSIVPEVDDLLNTETKPYRTGRQSPPSPTPMESTTTARSRQRSSSRRGTETRARSSSKLAQDGQAEEQASALSPEVPSEPSVASRRPPQNISKKALAAKELEERRLSLARRTPIPQPGELSGNLAMSPKSAIEGEMLSSRTFNLDSHFLIRRSQTVDPDFMQRQQQGLKTSGTSTPSVPIGLPATPRAMRHPRYMGSDADERDVIPAVPALPDNLFTLAPVTYQPKAKETDDIGPLLPATVYGGQRPPFARSASAPPEKYVGSNKISTKSNNHSRHTSERDVSGLHQPNDSVIPTQTVEEEVIVVGNDNDLPPVLAELAHLAGPPPPPPPPTMYQHLAAQTSSGVINIAIDEGNESASLNKQESPYAEEVTTMPQHVMTLSSRSRQNSLETANSSNSKGGNSNSKWRQISDRMRTGSRSRNSTKSPNLDPSQQSQYLQYQNLTNESTLASMTYSRSPKASPPYETNVEGSSYFPAPPAPPPLFTNLSANPGDTASPNSANPSSASGYRNPKEIRANWSQERVPSVSGDRKTPSPPQATTGNVTEAVLRGGFF